jgi:type 1 glutamine amidotransferase
VDLIAAILVVTVTAGFRHESIGTAETVIQSIATRSGVRVHFARTEEEALQAMSPENLTQFRAVMFVHTTGEIAVARRNDLLRWVEDGGVFVGVHSAADTWHESDEYLAMIGAEFVTHPPEYAAVVHIDDPRHVATVGLESPHVIFEEIYHFGRFDAARVRLLMSIRDAEVLPLAWDKTYGRGRVLYSALGHRSETWLEPWFQQHIAGALQWALNGNPVLRRRAVVSGVRRP